jgi:LSD1 subclass zinc finger protein
MPIQVVCDTCRSPYTLKDEFAGKKVRCKECQTIIVVPDAVPGRARPSVDRGYHPAFDRDKFLVNQKRISISEKYYVYDEDGNPILFIERPAHFLRNLGAAFAGVFTAIFVTLLFTLAGIALEQQGFKNLGGIAALVGIIVGIVLAFVVGIRLSAKRHITVYTDDSKAEPLLEILQDQKVSLIRATYTVNDPRDGNLGKFRKNYLYNVFRKRWHVLDPEGSVRMLSMEDSLILSLLRRLFGPMLGLLRTNFIIVKPDEATVIGEFNRKMTIFDRYVLDMSADPGHALDRRMAVALGVLLDTGERR